MYRGAQNPWVKGQCLFWFGNSTTEGRGGEKGGSANSRTDHTEPLTQGFCAPPYQEDVLALHAQGYPLF